MHTNNLDGVIRSKYLLLTGLSIVTVHAAEAAKPERYEAALEELKNFLNNVVSMLRNELSVASLSSRVAGKAVVE